VKVAVSDDGIHEPKARALRAAGFEDRLLLSHDRGWYDPSEPDGGDQRPFTYLPGRVLPAPRDRVGPATADAIVRDDPFETFAR